MRVAANLVLHLCIFMDSSIVKEVYLSNTYMALFKLQHDIIPSHLFVFTARFNCLANMVIALYVSTMFGSKCCLRIA